MGEQERSVAEPRLVGRVGPGEPPRERHQAQVVHSRRPIERRVGVLAGSQEQNYGEGSLQIC